MFKEALFSAPAQAVTRNSLGAEQAAERPLSPAARSEAARLPLALARLPCSPPPQTQSPEELRQKFPAVFSQKAAAPAPAPTLDPATAHIHINSRRRFGGQQMSSAGYGEPVLTMGEKLQGMHLV